MSIVTVKPVVLENVPRPSFRFDGTDASIVTANRPTTFGASGLPVAPPDEAAAGFNIGSGETKSTIEARTGDPAGYITWATDTNDIYVGDGSDNLAFYTDVKD